MNKTELSPVLFIPHGGGPLPLLGDVGHKPMLDFLKKITPTLGRPDAILLISAHWEESIPTITSGPNPDLIYDYSGFPDEAYEITYPAPGNPALAQKIDQLLSENNIEAKLDDQRGFDHGMYVPLKLMYPEANIPCVQLSLLNSLDPDQHIKMGKALSALRQENILVIGSGFSFHNLRALMSGRLDSKQNESFEHWLAETCTSTGFDEEQRESRLKNWKEAPGAIYCHPREEHLLPLHVCYGIAGAPAELVFNDRMLNALTTGYLWQ